MATKERIDNGTGLGFTASELRRMSNNELLDRITASKDALLGMNTTAASELYGRKRHSDKPHLFGTYRRAIARIQTVLRERNIKV